MSVNELAVENVRELDTGGLVGALYEPASFPLHAPKPLSQPRVLSLRPLYLSLRSLYLSLRPLRPREQPPVIEKILSRPEDAVPASERDCSRP